MSSLLATLLNSRMAYIGQNLPAPTAQYLGIVEMKRDDQGEFPAQVRPDGTLWPVIYDDARAIIQMYTRITGLNISKLESGFGDGELMQIRSNVRLVAAWDNTRNVVDPTTLVERLILLLATDVKPGALAAYGLYNVDFNPRSADVSSTQVLGQEYGRHPSYKAIRPELAAIGITFELVAEVSSQCWQNCAQIPDCL